MTLDGSISLETRVLAIRECISCDLQGEAVVLNIQDGVYYGLNDVAARVWRLLQEPRTVAEVREALLEVYDVDPEVCVGDLRKLLQQFVEWRLVEFRNGSPD